MKTIPHSHIRLSAAVALLILIASNNNAGAQQFYDHGRRWGGQNTAVPDDYYRQAERVEGPITRSTPPFGYYAAPRPKVLYRVNWNEVNSQYQYNGSYDGLPRQPSRQRTRPQPDAYGQTSAHLNVYYPGSNAARALPGDSVYSTDLNGSLHVPHAPISQTNQTVTGKLIIPN
ncbi:MAG TPA: hypothetical protein V6D22_13315 [Candidatus Obscuribacterales bacterium]